MKHHIPSMNQVETAFSSVPHPLSPNYSFPVNGCTWLWGKTLPPSFSHQYSLHMTMHAFLHSIAIQPDTLQKMTNSLLVNVDIPSQIPKDYRISFYPSKIDLDKSIIFLWSSHVCWLTAPYNGCRFHQTNHQIQIGTTIAGMTHPKMFAKLILLSSCDEGHEGFLMTFH